MQRVDVKHIPLRHISESENKSEKLLWFLSFILRLFLLGLFRIRLVWINPYPSVITDDDYQRDQEEDEDVDEDKVFRGVFILLTDDTGNIVGPV